MAKLSLKSDWKSIALNNGTTSGTSSSKTSSSSSSSSSSGSSSSGSSSSSGKLSLKSNWKDVALEGLSLPSLTNSTTSSTSSGLSKTAASTATEEEQISKKLSDADTQLKAAETQLEQIKKRYGATEDAEGNLVFSTQDGLNAYSKAVQNYQSAAAAYNSAAQEYESYNSTSGKLSRIDSQLSDLQSQYDTLNQQSSVQNAATKPDGLFQTQVRYTTDMYDPFNANSVKAAQTTKNSQLADIQAQMQALQNQKWYLQAETDIDELPKGVVQILDQYVIPQGSVKEKYSTAFTPDDEKTGTVSSSGETQKQRALRQLKGMGYTDEQIKTMAEQRSALIDRQYAQEQMEGAKLDAEQHPILSSVASVLATPAKQAGDIEGIRAVLPEVLGGYHDKDRPTNIYSDWFGANNYSSTVRSQVIEDLEKEHPFSIGGVNVASMVYNAGMSAADSVINWAVASVFGGAGLDATTEAGRQAALQSTSRTMNWIMGSEVAADGVIEGITKGYSNEKALALGAIEGAIEAATETWSVERIINAVTSPNASALRVLVNSFVSEGGEEVAADWLNAIADLLANGNRSELKTEYDARVSSGQSGLAALIGTIWGQVTDKNVQSFLAGGLAGAMMGGVSMAGYGVKNSAENYATASALQSDLDSIQALVDQGLAAGQGTQAYKTAQEIQEKVKKRRLKVSEQLKLQQEGKTQTKEERTITKGELAKLIRQNERVAQQQEYKEYIQSLTAEGLAADPSSEAHKLAQKIRERTNAGKDIDNRTLERYTKALEARQSLSLPTVEGTAEAASEQNAQAEQDQNVQRGVFATAEGLPLPTMTPTVRNLTQQLSAEQIAQTAQNQGVGTNGTVQQQGTGAGQSADTGAGVQSTVQSTGVNQQAVVGQQPAANVRSGAGIQFGANVQTGQSVSDANGGRDTGTGTGGSAGTVAAGTERLAARETQRESRKRRADAVEAQGVGWTSLRNITGAISGVQASDAQTVRIVPATVVASDPELSRIRQQNRRQGIQTRFFLGDAELENGGSVEGWYTEGRSEVWIKADGSSEESSAAKLNLHEMTHLTMSRNPGMRSYVAKRLMDTYGEAEVRTALEKYLQAHEGLYEDMEGTDEATGLTMRELTVMEELMADAVAGRTRWKVDAGAWQGTVSQAMTDYQQENAAEPSEEAAAATEQTTGPPAENTRSSLEDEAQSQTTRFSIDYDADNRPFVTIDEDILDGVPREDWVKKVKATLREKFPNGITVGRSQIKLSNKTVGEMMRSGSSHVLERNNPQIFADKLRATNNADEVLKATQNWVNEPLAHPRKDAIIDFARGTVQMRIGENEYEADVLVANQGQHGLLLYDIANLQPTNIQERKKRAGADDTLLIPEGSSRSLSAPATVDTITQSEDVVNPQFSDVVQSQLTGENPTRFSVAENEEDVTQREDAVTGSSGQTWINGRKAVNFTWAVVPADALVISNDESGHANPAYPSELQPRNRASQVSRGQISIMAQNLNPAMLAESPTAQNGAPLIRPDGVVIGGNGRSAAIELAYRNGHAGEYQSFIQQQGSQYGLDTSTLPKRPVLVRVIQDAAGDWQALSRELNVSTTDRYSATETGESDAKKLQPSMIRSLVQTEGGGINNAANRDFIWKFVQNIVPESERGSTVTADGMLSRSGVTRAQDALFAYAYEDTTLLQREAESVDDDTRNVTGALLDTVPAAAKVREGEQSGELYRMHLVDGVKAGVQLFQSVKDEGYLEKGAGGVDAYLQQTEMTYQEDSFSEFVARFIEGHRRSRARMRLFFSQLYDKALTNGAAEGGMFDNPFLMGTPQEYTRRSALRDAALGYRNALDERGDTPETLSLPSEESWTERTEYGIEAPVERAEEAEPSAESQAETEGILSDLQRGQDEFFGERVTSEGRGEPSETQQAAKRKNAEKAEKTAWESSVHEAGLMTDEEERALQREMETLDEGGQWEDMEREEGETDEEFEQRNLEYHAAQSLMRKRNTQTEFDKMLAERSAQVKQERTRNVSREDFQGSGSLEKLGVRITNSVGRYSDTQQMRARDKAAKSVQRAAQREAKRLQATEAEKTYARNIANGVFSDRNIPADMDANTVLTLADFYTAEETMGLDMISQTRRDIRSGLEYQMSEMFKGVDADKIKVPRMEVLNLRTPERIMRSVFGQKKGAEVNAAVFDAVSANEAERFRWVNRQFDQVRTFEDSQGKQKALNKDERALTMHVMEGTVAAEAVAGSEMRTAIENAAKAIRKGGDAAETAQKFGLYGAERKLAEQYAQWLETQEALTSPKVDKVKVENAAAKYADLFDQYYEAINDFLVAHGYEPIGYIKGYAPHLQPDDTQDLFHKALQHFGMEPDVTQLPVEIAGRTSEFRPNHRWNPFFLTRTGTEAKYDIATAFESYVEYLSDVLYHTDDIMRVRAMDEYFRREYAQGTIKDEIDQAREKLNAPLEDQRDFLRALGKDNGGIDDKTVLSPEDTLAKLDEYLEKLYEKADQTSVFSNLAMWLTNYANILAGKQNYIDRSREYGVGRKLLNWGSKLVGTFGRAQVAGNLSSALNQAAQLPQIQAELGFRNTTGAFIDLITGKIGRGGWAQQSDFLTEKAGIDYILQTPGQQVVTWMFKPAEMMDTLMSTLAVRGKYRQAIQQGMSEQEALKAADRFGKDVMGSRAKGSKPLSFTAKNPLWKAMTVFQVEAINTWEHVGQDIWNRDIRQIAEEKGKAAAVTQVAARTAGMVVLAFMLNSVANMLYGGSPAPFDLLGWLESSFASGVGSTSGEVFRTFFDNAAEKLAGERPFGTDGSALQAEDFDVDAAAEDLFYNMSNDAPFFRNVSGLLGWGDETLPMPNFGDVLSSFFTNGLFSDETLDAAKELPGELLPGGKQLSKIAQGLPSALSGGVYTDEDEPRLKYPIENASVSDIAGAVDENGLLSDETMEALLGFGRNVKAAAFGNSSLAASDAFYNSDDTALTVKQTQLYDSLVEQGADKLEVYRAIQDIRAIGNDESLTSEEKGKQKRAVIRQLDLSDGQKLTFYREMMTTDSEEDEEEGTGTTAKLREMMDTGLSFNRVLDIYDQYKAIDADENMNATEKATQFAAWLDQQSSLTGNQAKAAKEQLLYWQRTPATAGKYDKFTAAGLDSDEAVDVTEALSNIGEDPSTVEKYRAIADMPLDETDKGYALSAIMSESAYANYESVMASGLSTEDYVQFLENIQDISGDGKQERIWNVIDNMPITSAQKDALHLVAGYKESTLKNAPWH